MSKSPWKRERGQVAGAVGGGGGGDAGGVALGGRGHGFGAGVDHADRAVQQPGGDGGQRLHGQVELAAEAAADGGGDDADIGHGDAEDRADLVAVHVGGLGAGDDLDAVADAAGVAGLGLDVGVLDEAGGGGDAGGDGGFEQGGVDVAGADAAAAEDVGRGVGVQRWGGVGVVEGDGPAGGSQVMGRSVSRMAARVSASPTRAQTGSPRWRTWDFGQHGLVLAGGVDAVEVAAGDVGGGQDFARPGWAA